MEPSAAAGTRVRVLDAVCFVYTCRRLIDLSLIAGGLMQKIAPTAQMHAFDLDPEAITVGKELEAEDSRFTIHHRPFGELGGAIFLY